MCEAWVSTNHQKSEQKDYHAEDQPGLHSEFQRILGYTVKTLYWGREKDERETETEKMMLMSIIRPQIYVCVKLGKKQQRMSEQNTNYS